MPDGQRAYFFFEVFFAPFLAAFLAAFFLATVTSSVKQGSRQRTQEALHLAMHELPPCYKSQPMHLPQNVCGGCVLPAGNWVARGST